MSDPPSARVWSPPSGYVVPQTSVPWRPLPALAQLNPVRADLCQSGPVADKLVGDIGRASLAFRQISDSLFATGSPLVADAIR